MVADEPEEEVTADDVAASWLTPQQAIQILNQAYDDEYLARQTLLNRLQGGMVKALSTHSVYEPEYSRSSSHAVLEEIAAEDWSLINTSNNVWQTGDMTYRRRRYSRTEYEIVRHYGVRFEPISVRAILPVTKTPADQPSQEEEEKGPPVSDAHLKIWLEAYQKIYGGTSADTLATALKSARGMFPGKFVSRDRIRKLLEGRKPGRKPGPAD